MDSDAGSTGKVAGSSSKTVINQHDIDSEDRINQGNAVAIPGPNLLVRLSRSAPGQLAGSYTTKAIAGCMIGAGVLCLLSGYGVVVGIPLIASGGALWLLSTTLSVAAIEDKGPLPVILHLIKSLLSLAGGTALSFVLAFFVPGAAAFISGAFVGIPVSGIALTLASFGLDYKNLEKSPAFAYVMHSDIRSHMTRAGGNFYENPADVRSALAYIKQGNNPTAVFLRYLDTDRNQKARENPQDLDKLTEVRGFPWKDMLLSHADLKNIHFDRLELLNNDFSGVDFRYSKFTRCRFINCIFEQANLTETEIEHCVFEKCFLKSADFTDAIQVDSSFKDCFNQSFYHVFAFNVVSNPDEFHKKVPGRASLLIATLAHIYLNVEKFSAAAKLRAAYEILCLDDATNDRYTLELKMNVAKDVIQDELVYTNDTVKRAIAFVLTHADSAEKELVGAATKLLLRDDPLIGSNVTIKSWNELADEWD